MDKRKKILLIINPISGNGNKEKLLPLIASTLNPEAWNATVAVTERARHATELAWNAVDQGYEAVVAIGGDGTINEVASALCGTDIAMGIVPCGSGNGLARHLHIPGNPAQALEIINHGIVEKLDYCTVNDQPFFCTCGCGFDAKVSHTFAKDGTRGMVSYMRAAFKEFIRYKSKNYRISIDGQEFSTRAFVVACCNAAQYGNNAFVAPHASMQDGKVDITVIDAVNHLEGLVVGAKLMTKTIEKDRNVSIYRGTKVIIEREGRDIIHIDGDPVVMPARLNIECHPSGIGIIVNTTRNI